MIVMVANRICQSWSVENKITNSIVATINFEINSEKYFKYKPLTLAQPLMWMTCFSPVNFLTLGVSLNWWIPCGDESRFGVWLELCSPSSTLSNKVYSNGPIFLIRIMLGRLSIISSCWSSTSSWAPTMYSR